MVRREAQRGTEESVGWYGGKRRVVRREASGGTEGSVWRYGGKRREVRRKASGGSEESVGRFGGKLREVRGKRRVVRREAQGGTEESVGRYGGKHREVRRKASGGTEESARNYKERGGGYPSAFKKWVSAFAVLIMGTACEVAIKCGATGKEEVRRTGYLKSSIWGSEEIGRDKGGGKLGEAEAESAQLVAIAWGGV